MREILTTSPALVGGLLVVLAIVAAIPAIIALLRQVGVAEQIQRRLLRKPAGEGGGGLFSDLPQRDAPKWIDAIADWFHRAAPSDTDAVSAIRYKLIQAGYTNRNAVTVYYVARLLGLILPQLGLLFALPTLAGFDLPEWFPLAISGFLAVGGLALPGIIVERRIEAKALACSRGFPDMMDLLVSCVEAGLSLDAAVMRVSEELVQRHPELSIQLKTIGLELRAGRSRKAAWRAFADRVGIEEAGALATMLRQSEELGTSLGQTLRIFSKDMRQRRILAAEEKAMALPAKMTVPLIVFVFPVLLGVLIMPAVVRFQDIL